MTVTGINSSIPIHAPQATRPPRRSAHGFVSVLEKLVDSVNGRQLKAEEAVKDFAAGKMENVHDVMLAELEADISFRMLLQARNKLVEAYKEIMRMQI